MKKMIMLFIALTTSIALVACNNNDHNNHATNDSKKEEAPLKATLTVPDTAKVGDKVVLKVTVTKESKAFTDAKDVAFEIENIKTNFDKMIAAKLMDNSYVATYKVQDAGKYNITAHVSAKDGNHVMPNTEIEVDNAPTKSEHATQNTSVKSTTEEHEHHHDVAITYNHKHSVEKDSEVKLNVSLKHDDKVLSGASVHYQVLPQFDDGKPTWITLNETSKGTYEAKYTFSQAGKYQLKLHVENDDGLHSHEVKNFLVK